MQFLEQLGSIMGLDEVSRELGFDLQTDALIARSEQLAKLEGERLADKVCWIEHSIQCCINSNITKAFKYLKFN